MTPVTHQPGGRDRTVRVALAALGVLVAVALGANAVVNTTGVLAVILLIALLPMVNSRPVTWIALAVTITWTSRLLTVVGSAPRFLDFLDFPLVLIAFLFAGVRFLGGRRTLDKDHARIGHCLLLATIVVTLSWAFNDLHEPQRLIAGWVLAVEPFLLLMAVLLAPLTVREHRFLTILLAVLLCGQLAFSSVQIALGAVADEVKGTLFAAGAGHHVSAGGLILGFFLLSRMGYPRFVAVLYGAGALFAAIVADAKQVLFVVPPAILVLAITGRKRSTGGATIAAVLSGLVMAAGSAYALVSYQASSTALDFVDRSSTNGTGKFAVVSALASDLSSTPTNLIFGLGPGESVSRFAFLTTPALLKEGSPVTLLGLHASRGSDKYNDIAFSGPFTGNSSFTSAQSSIMGIVGDYGIAGGLTFVLLIAVIMVAIRQTPQRELRSAALAAWALLLPLAVIFDWLEQPPFTLAVVLMTGLALRARATLDGDSANFMTNPDAARLPDFKVLS
jgi:hypothetical protein